MFKNISFVGGIHGVGKSTICKKICDQLEIQYLSASDVLSWAKISTDPLNKCVESVPHTQDLLIEGLKKIVVPSKKYLLDGHFCLLNKDNHITKIPFETFKAICPVSLGLITNDTVEIKRRLESRDQRNYDIDLLEEMQSSEIEYANELALQLGIKLSQGRENDFERIINSIKGI